MSRYSVVVRNGFVMSVYFGKLSVRRKGTMFELRLKPEDGGLPRTKRSMYLDRLLAAELKNRKLAHSIVLVFGLLDPSPEELTRLLPRFYLNFTPKKRRR